MWIRRTQNMKRERVKGCYLLLAVGAPSGGGAKEYIFFFATFFPQIIFLNKEMIFFLICWVNHTYGIGHTIKK